MILHFVTLTQQTATRDRNPLHAANGRCGREPSATPCTATRSTNIPLRYQEVSHETQSDHVRSRECGAGCIRACAGQARRRRRQCRWPCWGRDGRRARLWAQRNERGHKQEQRQHRHNHNRQIDAIGERRRPWHATDRNHQRHERLRHGRRCGRHRHQHLDQGQRQRS